MPLDFLVKQMLGEITLPQSMTKTQKTEIKQPIIFKCYAHITNNGHIGMSRKNKTKDSDMNVQLTFDGNTKQLIEAKFICPLQNERKMYDSSKFVLGL